MLEFDTPSYLKNVLTLVGDYLIEAGLVRGNPVDKVGQIYENDTFLLQSYGIDEENAPLFWHKTINIQVDWYQNIYRASTTNLEIGLPEALQILWDCLESIDNDPAAVWTASPDLEWDTSSMEDDD